MGVWRLIVLLVLLLMVLILTDDDEDRFEEREAIKNARAALAKASP